MIERDFDIGFVARQSFREKQIQQNYRPVIAVHKWFARRPGSLFRSLLLAEFGGGHLATSFFESNDLSGIRVADPFMGGGTPLVEANRLGCDVIGYDINPMAYWIVRQEIETLDLQAYGSSVDELISNLESQIGSLYRTRCTVCGKEDAHVKYFIWVKTQQCDQCGKDVDLFPGYLLAGDRRHTRNVLICPICGELVEVESLKSPGRCTYCGSELQVKGNARGGRFVCPCCGKEMRYLPRSVGPPTHRMVGIEYHCLRCKGRTRGRFFKRPDPGDLENYASARARLASLDSRYIPDDDIPPGDETNRLLKWGYRKYKELFNDRQLLGLELSARAIAANPDSRVRNALATNLSDLLRYQNMLCRYDTMALKSLDVFSIHGFPVSLIQCESNLLGISAGRGSGVNVGSGGWSNVTEKYRRAKEYCMRPFEVLWEGRRKTVVNTPDEWIGDRRGSSRERLVDLRCGSSTEASIPRESLDIVLTDPPYFSNVQYAELMDFCYIWLRRLVGDQPAFSGPTTRSPQELTGNETEERGLAHFASGLSDVFRNMAGAMKPGAALVFTYHHNSLEAYYPVALAILDAGLTCTRVFPCPGEMGASIHINGTGSSTVDSVFVCRHVSHVDVKGEIDGAFHIIEEVRDDIDRLLEGEVAATRGDIRCVVYGHFIKTAIRSLGKGWQSDRPVPEKLRLVGQAVHDIGDVSQVEGLIQAGCTRTDEVAGGNENWGATQNILLK